MKDEKKLLSRRSFLKAGAAGTAAGASVVLVDKGPPGYSGLSPFVSSHRWFDAEMGDDPEVFRACINRGGDYIGSMNWYQVWIDESKAMAERLMDWGVLIQYPTAAEEGFWEDQDYRGYHNKHISDDRREAFLTGMCVHLSSGVFCGNEELEGFTGITGLYVAGDGMNMSGPTGAYPVGVGFTSSFCSLQGDHAGKAAAESTESKNTACRRVHENLPAGCF